MPRLDLGAGWHDLRFLSFGFLFMVGLLTSSTWCNPSTDQMFRPMNFPATHAWRRISTIQTEFSDARGSYTNFDFNRAFGDAKKQAAGVAGEVSDAAQDLYGQAADSASQVADATTRAARKTAGSFEKAIRNTIENQPYTAVIAALVLGWLFGECTARFDIDRAGEHWNIQNTTRCTALAQHRTAACRTDLILSSLSTFPVFGLIRVHHVR